MDMIEGAKILAERFARQDASREGGPVKCDNCQHPLVDHCRVHLIPCCPGKCSAEQPREWTVSCGWTASCGWTGTRSAVSQREAQADPCPKCGSHVRASGSRTPEPENLRPGSRRPGAERYHLR